MKNVAWPTAFLATFSLWFALVMSPFAGARTWPPTPVAEGEVQPATTSVAGIVELANSREDAANVVVQGNDTRLDAFVGSGVGHQSGLVPDPGAVSGTTNFLREDGVWAEIDAEFAAGVELTDNLADAFNVGEGVNDYVVITSTNNSEKLVVFKRLLITDAVASGTERIVGGLAFSSATASTAILGTVETETNFDVTYELPANSIREGTLIRIGFGGAYTVSTDTDTHVFHVKADAVSLATTFAFDPADDDVFWGEMRLVGRAVGASGVVVGQGELFSGVRNIASGARIFLSTGTGTTSGTTIDTTTALTIAVAVDRGVTDDVDSMRLDWLTVEVTK